jgi:hypothetical protein
MPLAAGAAAADLPGESALRAWRERRKRVCAAGAAAQDVSALRTRTGSSVNNSSFICRTHSSRPRAEACPRVFVAQEGDERAALRPRIPVLLHLPAHRQVWDPTAAGPLIIDEVAQFC